MSLGSLLDVAGSGDARCWSDFVVRTPLDAQLDATSTTHAAVATPTNNDRRVTLWSLRRTGVLFGGEIGGDLAGQRAEPDFTGRRLSAEVEEPLQGLTRTGPAE